LNKSANAVNAARLARLFADQLLSTCVREALKNSCADGEILPNGACDPGKLSKLKGRLGEAFDQVKRDNTINNERFNGTQVYIGIKPVNRLQSNLNLRNFSVSGKKFLKMKYSLK